MIMNSRSMPCKVFCTKILLGAYARVVAYGCEAVGVLNQKTFEQGCVKLMLRL